MEPLFCQTRSSAPMKKLKKAPPLNFLRPVGGDGNGRRRYWGGKFLEIEQGRTSNTLPPEDEFTLSTFPVTMTNLIGLRTKDSRILWYRATVRLVLKHQPTK